MRWKASTLDRIPLAVRLLGCVLAFSGRDAVVHAGAPVSTADKGVPEKLDVDLTRFLIRVRSERASRSVEAWDHRRGVWHGLKCIGDAVYEAPRSRALLGPRGEARLRIDPPPEGVYLLGGYARNALPLDSLNWLRTHSLAYVEGRFTPGEEIRLSHRSQRVEIQRAAGGVARIALNGEAILAGPVQIRVRGEPARFDQPAGVFRDAWDNPIDVRVRELGDRLRFHVAYTIEHPRDTWSDVRVVFSPAPTVDRFETLCWYGNEDRFTSSPVDEEVTSVLCQNPFVLVRSAQGPFLGFLDHDQSNLFFRATPEEASVEYWAWPKEQGARYQWTFEVIPGYGVYANAFLRALDPHTAGFRRRVHGHAGFLGATRRPEEAAAAGVRVVWYHGCWFHRNGKYFDPQQPLEAEYETAAGQLSTYADRIEDIRRAHEAGIKVCIYTQFTGISGPAVADFESSMVRDLDGNLIRVGHDGKYDNIWANPNPDLPYGRSFIEQVDGMIRTFGCDGIAMDRTDRLDNRHGKHVNEGGNAGIMVHADALPQTGAPYPCSVEVQAKDDDHGSIFGIRGCTVTALTNPRSANRAQPLQQRSKPAGQWNRYRLTSKDGALALEVNGKLVTRVKDCSQVKGHVCLESERSEVHFRNMRLTPLPSSDPPAERIGQPAQGFISLFDGVSFHGWKHLKGFEGHWVAKDGVISCDGKVVVQRGGERNLWTEKEYADFVLMADWRLPAKPLPRQMNDFTEDGLIKRDQDGKRITHEVLHAGDSGIYLRGDRRAQVNIWCQPMGSGDINPYHKDASLPEEIRRACMPKINADNPPGQWNRFIITMQGYRVTVVLNGQTVIEKAKLPGVAECGPIGLQNHGDPIGFRNLFIKPLEPKQ